MWPTSLDRRSFSAAMLASSWGSIASMAVATSALMRAHLHHNRLDDVVDGNTGCRDMGAYLQ